MDPRFILAVDSSGKMALGDRMDLVRNAFSYFLLYELPRNAKAGIINLKETKSRKSLFLPLRTASNVERLIDVFPEAYGNGDLCVHCGIQEALKQLKTDMEQPRGVILIVTTTDIAQEWVKNITKELSASDVTLSIVYFGSHLQEMPLLSKLAQSSGGRFFYIPETFPAESSFSTLTYFYEIFRAVYQALFWTNKDHILVDHWTFSDNSSEYSVSFTSDISVEEFQVLLTGPNFLTGPPVIKDKIILKNKYVLYSPGHESFAYKIKIPAYMFTIKNPEPGTWTLSFERKPPYNNTLVVIVRGINKRSDDVINIHSWFEDSPYSRMEESSPIPPKIYSEVSHGNHPVVNITVKAVVYDVANRKETSLLLKDTGEGDPDITGNDGIFSRYFVKTLQQGFYLLTVIVEGSNPELPFANRTLKGQGKKTKCCGSSVPVHLAYDSGPFKRVVTYGSFYISKLKRQHKYSPRRIVDLRVTAVNMIRNDVALYTLEWTCPGEDYDHGTAAEYELKVFRNRNDALNNFNSTYVQTINEWNIHGPWLIPQPAGTRQSIIMQLKPTETGVYFLALRTTDHSNLIGDVSNVVQIWYTMPLIPVTSSVETEIPNGNVTDDSINEVREIQLLNSHEKLTIGVVCGLLFLTIVIGVFCFVYLEHRRNRRNKKQNLTDHKTDSNDALCHSSNIGNVSIISPVNSWPAGSLISHYETLKRNKHGDNGNVPSIIHAKTVDDISISSNKQPFAPEESSSSLYDPVCFHHGNIQDPYNYPFDLNYVPFNPMYTSSLRRLHDNNRLSLASMESGVYRTSTLDGRRMYRLRTDV